VGVPVDLLLADALEGGANGLNGRLHRLLVKNPRDELARLLPADRFALRARIAAGSARVPHPAVQLVHVAQRKARPLRDGRVGVARAGDVDHQRSGIAVSGGRALRKRLGAEGRLLRAGGDDDEIGARSGGVALPPRHRFRSRKRAGGLGGALRGAVGDRHRREGRSVAGAVRQGFERQSAHFPRPHQEHAAVGPAVGPALPEKVFGQRHGGGRDAGGPARQARLASHALGRAEGRVHQAVPHRPDGVGLDGAPVGVFDLREDLRVAGHERAQARRHLQDVAHGRLVGAVEGLLRARPASPRLAGQQPTQALGVLVGAVEVGLRAVARGKEHQLGAVPVGGPGPGAERGVHAALRLPRKRKRLARGDGGRLVVESEGVEGSLHAGLGAWK